MSDFRCGHNISDIEEYCGICTDARLTAAAKAVEALKRFRRTGNYNHVEIDAVLAEYDAAAKGSK